MSIVCIWAASMAYQKTTVRSPKDHPRMATDFCTKCAYTVYILCIYTYFVIDFFLAYIKK